MSDERILGEPDFVSEVLAQANEQYERRYELKQRGYDLERLADRVSQNVFMPWFDVIILFQ